MLATLKIMGSAKRGPLCHMVLPISLKILIPVWHICEFPKNYLRCPPSLQCTWYSEPYHSKQLFGNMSSFYFQRYEFKCNSRNFIIQNDSVIRLCQEKIDIIEIGYRHMRTFLSEVKFAMVKTLSDVSPTQFLC